MEELGVPVLLVGRHVSAMPDHALLNSNVEFVALREYEFTVQQVAEYYLGKLEKPLIKGVAYLRDDNEFVTPTGHSKRLRCASLGNPNL